MINIKLIDKNYKWQEVIQPHLAEAENKLGDSGRIVIRASGTEPLLRIMVEALSVDISSQIANSLSQIITRSML